MDRHAPQVVIIGAGFAGLEVAKRLGHAGIATTVIDRRNHHLFQPLLYQVATAALSATDIAVPIRRILRRHRSLRVIFGEVARIDAPARRLHLTCGETVDYRCLVVATGAGHGYFGHDEWAQWAPGLKTIEDARHIRSRLLMTFERAERTSDPDERRRLLEIAVIGGGPTGVELAGAIAELSRHTLQRDFRTIDPQSARITLIEAGPRVLSGFDDSLSTYARRRLDRIGVTVLTGAPVEHIGPDAITLAGVRRPVGVVIWAAGVTASPLAAQLGATDRTGRVVVDPNLQVRDQHDIFALGDMAALAGEDGRPLPGLAQVARQQGIHLGRSLADHLAKGRPLAPFHYAGRGNTAIIGRHAAVFEQGRFRIAGWFAWLSWALIHVYLLVGFQNRALVAAQWLWRYLTHERGARLIAQGDPSPDSPGASPPPTGEKGPARVCTPHDRSIPAKKEA